MTATTAHIINHTHWDREWFLTSVYTRQWLPGLIDTLEALVAANPEFCFFFDGQTLVIEDLLQVAPAYAARVRALIRGGHLLIGPYYCQPDWQQSSGELLWRNLLLGHEDVARYGGTAESGWLVDTFGHIRQSPQLHRLAGISSLYVWRGVPVLDPYFWWEGPDGSRLLTINLFGGYRNLYGVTHVPELAASRLHSEIAKLRPYYPTPDIPLFDGYDLEDNPEDPVTFYQTLDGLGPDVVVREATPPSFAALVRGQPLSLPVSHSELNSGKYGATFPGTLSARTYLKILASDCERLLFGLCEPLAALAWLRGRVYEETRYEAWSRLLLQNAVHDCLCGVSIDQVHEKMEDGYRRAFEAMSADVVSSLQPIFADFAPGLYAVNTQPLASESWQVLDDRLVRVNPAGVGVTPIEVETALTRPERAVASFSWKNDHYEATIGADGLVQLGAARLGQMRVFAEHGDTYSEQQGALLGELRPAGPLIVEEENAAHAVVRYEAAWHRPDAGVTATVRVQMDRSPLIRWQIALDSRGTDLQVEMVFATAQPGAIWAGMPFDVTPRAAADQDLLPQQLPPELASVLLGQRELHAVTTFPFHDFVAVSDGDATAAVFARGLHAYRADGAGTVTLHLRRAVEWLTKTDLADREGDAGPAFYVPDARCERQVLHELAFAAGTFGPASTRLLALNATFQQPPLLVRKEGAGARRSWQLYRESLPQSSLRVVDEKLQARLYNPAPQPQPLSQRYAALDMTGATQEAISALAPYHIVTLQVEAEKVELGAAEDGGVTLLARPQWRVGVNRSRPDSAVLAQLAQQIGVLDQTLGEAAAALAASQGAARLRQQHQIYVLERQRLELQLSRLLNLRKLAQGDGPPGADYLYGHDEEIAALGLALNQMRIKRRIYDYVVQVA
ncbi:MAG: hypothetical protein RRC07_08930 [Anaerolineae bacterium]|nr:hypothetical protein [Anaerolineae bacterium]